MNRKQPEPPRLASWLLRYARPRGDDAAFEGDLLEQFREGRTGGWFWRQVLVACAVRVVGAVQQQWPVFGYATVATAIPTFSFESVMCQSLASMLRWWTLPWPLSQLVFEYTSSFFLVLGALPALGVGLLIKGEFSWASIFRTALINLVLLILGRWLLFDAFVLWFTVPRAGYPYLRTMAASVVIQILVLLAAIFSMSFASAWLGCRRRRAGVITSAPHRA